MNKNDNKKDSNCNDLTPCETTNLEEEILKEHPELGKDEARLMATKIEMSQSYSSPFPPPNHLEQYAALYPDAPEVIFEHFRNEQPHRHEMEAKGLQGAIDRDRRAQYFAAILCVIFLIAAIYCAHHGWYWLSGGTVVGIFSTVITGYLGSNKAKDGKQ